MKTCPNCGSKMDVDVNFCTNCGADIRNVPEDAVAQPQEEPKAEQPVQQTRREQRVANQQVNSSEQQAPTQPVQPTQQQTQPAQQPVQQNANTRSQQSAFDSEAVKAHAANMWQWFVSSWKHPFADQQGEKWYGWVTLLVENVLLVLGLYICVNKYSQDQLGNSDIGQAAQTVVSNFSTSLLFELFLYLVLVIVAMIAVAYYAHKFIYGSTENLFNFVNRIVSCSNISAILYVVSFVCLIIGSEDMLKIGLPLAGIAMTLFSLAVYAVVVGDSAPAVQDKFYGLLIVVVVQVVVMYVLGKIFGSAVYNQIQQLIHSSTNGMF